MYADDPTRLRHMLESAREAQEFSINHDQAVLENDRMRYHAIKDCLGIIGEAAFNISRDFKDNHPEIQWSDLVRMRNRLVHDYFMIDPDVMWTTVIDILPDLTDELEKLVLELDVGN